MSKMTPRKVLDLYDKHHQRLNIIRERFNDDFEAEKADFLKQIKQIGEVQGVALTLDRNLMPVWVGVRKHGHRWVPVSFYHHSQAKKSLKQKEMEDFFKANKGKKS